MKIGRKRRLIGEADMTGCGTFCVILCISGLKFCGRFLLRTSSLRRLVCENLAAYTKLLTIFRIFSALVSTARCCYNGSLLCVIVHLRDRAVRWARSITGALKACQMSFAGELFSAGSFHTWKKRSFVLANAELSVQRKKGRNAKCLITLDKGTRVEFSEKGRHCYIKIEKNGKKIRLRSPDRETVLRWVLELRTAVFHDPVLSMDQFNIIAVIGRGYYGKVMLVSSKSTNEKYAIKTIHKNKLIQARQLQIVSNERAILSKVDHPFIISLKFAFQSPTKFYLGMDYVPGGDLMKLLSTHRQIPISDVKLYVMEVALALDAMHRSGVVYRNLKPDNVLRHVKLVGFGLSKDISATATTNTFCGTTELMAPEVILLKNYSYAADAHVRDGVWPESVPQ